MAQRIRIGVIADDFTGASDAASFLVKGGHATVLLTTVSSEFDTPCDALVIALKIRSVPATEAVSQVKRAIQLFESLAPEHIYYKFCSTFDSTPRGNIGPVMDYLMDRLDVPYAVLCPSLPVNGRTVLNGVLYVDGTPLAASPLKDHPLNPMWDSYIPTLMGPQSRYPTYPIPGEMIRNSLENETAYDPIDEFLARRKRLSDRCYLIPDFETDKDGEAIARRFSDVKLAGGGSGILEHLRAPKSNKTNALPTSQPLPGAIMVCGSCSCASRTQIDTFKHAGGTCIAIDSKTLLEGTVTAESIFKRISTTESPALIFSDAVYRDIHQLAKAPTFDEESRLLEQFFSRLCVLARDAGRGTIIAAGGETSGAVAQALGYTEFYIGSSVAPGVPVLTPVADMSRRIILKSGNFGGDDFFSHALETAS